MIFPYPEASWRTKAPSTRAEAEWRPLSLGDQTVSSGSLLDAGPSFGQVFGDHHRMKFQMCVEGQEPRLGHRGYLRRIAHFEEDVRGALAVVVSEISGFRF